MIRIDRGPEPEALASVREDRVSRARDAISRDEPVDFSGYDIGKQDLFERQHHKCCYCEKLQEQAKYRDVEHYRPKHRYWWLAWTWENLLFACIDCNREYKRDQFPLAPGCSALEFPEVPPGREVPLVIDPSDPATEPMNEIEFRREQHQGNERWAPYGLTPRGWETIDVCGLDRPGLLTLYTEHVTHGVRPKLRPLFAAHHAGDARAAYQAWDEARRVLLRPFSEFRALSRDAMRVLVSEPLRRRYNLHL